MGVGEWFKTFCANLQISDAGTISSRYQQITQRLNCDFWDLNSKISHSLYVGSYGRNTAIKGFSDLDMIFQLPYSVYERFHGYYGNGQSSLLQEVKKSIERTYSKTSLKADGQVILVPFDDKVVFEVVPTFLNQDGSYTHPCSNNGGSWKTTNPKPEIQAIQARSNACNQNLVRLCRMMRSWRNFWNVPIGGLLIDTLAYQFIQNWGARDKSFVYYDYMCRDFFLWMKNQDSTQTYWRAPGSGQLVYGKGLFQYKAGQCYNLAIAAIDHEQASPTKREYSAKQKWREIFGTKFPD